ncbi:hypothetical protein FHL15_010927 [Xylaria flabelliformis]|uniref:U6 small nuclear RNA (adenine-(43)-N(6))-methyltransferase n=1 Tax=Xylaria flabelliformis TaxID=2512241 RepID=A0A553HJQ5_9PEZI|nr:hypothetical protein FHL15_010927 [Xylaria flabelliformis]
METTRLTQGTKRRYSGEQTGRSNYRSDDGNIEGSAPVGASSACPQRTPRTRDEGIAALSYDAKDHDEAYFKDIYTTEPNFARLGQEYPEFGSLLKDGVHLDFTNPAAVMALTKTLLKSDFGLEINLPSNRLCPPVPNRHNYILWLKDLLDSTSSSYTELYEAERKVMGLDIGTGASLIYPLLGCAQRLGWRFIATDIDAETLASARANARLNGLESRIRIVERGGSGEALIPLDELGIENIDFVMVNPPFYGSERELLDLARQKSQPPHSACTGAPVEMVCEGGEVKFVGRMIDESLSLGVRVQWYTAMLGKLSSLEALVEVLKRHNINNFAVTTFVQGSKTRRWGLAWSFISRRSSLEASRGLLGSNIAKKYLPPITAVTIYKNASQAPGLIQPLKTMLESLDLRQWAWDEKRLRGVGFSEGNVWSRAYRRKRAGVRADEGTVKKPETSVPSPDVSRCAFGFSVSMLPESPDKPTAILLHWLQGDDELLFESFTGLIRRCLRKDAVDSS